MRNLLHCLMLVCVSVTFASIPTCSHASRVASGGLAKPLQDQFFDVGPEPNDGYYVEIQSTSDAFVRIYDLLPNHTYQVSYAMNIGESISTSFVDGDTYWMCSRMTDGMGSWRHDAHDTGVLDGTDFFYIGYYRAWFHGEVNYMGSGGDPATADSERYFLVANG